MGPRVAHPGSAGTAEVGWVSRWLAVRIRGGPPFNGIVNPMSAPAAELVLVVDDDLLIAQLVEKYLVRAGYRVAIARDGLTALKLIPNPPPAPVSPDPLRPELAGAAAPGAAHDQTK